MYIRPLNCILKIVIMANFMYIYYNYSKNFKKIIKAFQIVSQPHKILSRINTSVSVHCSSCDTKSIHAPFQSLTTECSPATYSPFSLWTIDLNRLTMEKCCYFPQSGYQITINAAYYFIVTVYSLRTNCPVRTLCSFLMCHH